MAELVARTAKRPAMELGLSKDRANQIDAAVDTATADTATAKPSGASPATDKPAAPAITADAAAAAQKEREAKWAADDAAARNKPPSVLARVRRLIGID